MIEQCISTLKTANGSMTLLERHYDAQKDLALAVLGSRATGSHEWFRPEIDWQTGEKQGSFNHDAALSLAVQRCLGIIDEQCADTIRVVDAIAKRIEDRIPQLPGLDVHRQRLQGRRGYKINPHRVLRGQLSTAWTRVHRETQLNTTGVVTIVLCTDYTANATSNMAQHMIAATLALARKIEESGRRVELWASILTHNAHRMRMSPSRSFLVASAPQEFDELDHCVIKRAHEDLAAPSMAALCSLSLVRALFFQIWRLQYQTIGFMDNFGSATDKEEVYERLQPYLAREHIAPESVIMGADESDAITSIDKAVTWVTAWLQHVSQPNMLAAQGE